MKKNIGIFLLIFFVSQQSQAILDGGVFYKVFSSGVCKRFAVGAYLPTGGIFTVEDYAVLESKWPLSNSLQFEGEIPEWIGDRGVVEIIDSNSVGRPHSIGEAIMIIPDILFRVDLASFEHDKLSGFYANYTHMKSPYNLNPPKEINCNELLNLYFN